MMSHITMVTPKVSDIGLIDNKWKFIIIIKSLMASVHWLFEIIPFSIFNLWPVWVSSWLKLWFISFVPLLWFETSIWVGLVVVLKCKVLLLDLLNIVS